MPPTDSAQTPRAPSGEPRESGVPGLLEAEVGGRLWRLARPADLESLWEGMGEGDLGDDERLPYWVELWPAAVLLARFVAESPERVRGRVCLDAGCGLGLSSLVAASVGGRVLGFDYEPEALVYARRNIDVNAALLGGAPPPLFAAMDWRRPAVARGAADVLLGADILYERRFFEPVAALLDHALGPDGAAYLADPERGVSAPVWERLAGLGWRVATVHSGRVAQGGQDMIVHIRRVARR